MSKPYFSLSHQNNSKLWLWLENRKIMGITIKVLLFIYPRELQCFHDCKHNLMLISSDHLLLPEIFIPSNAIAKFKAPLIYLNTLHCIPMYLSRRIENFWQHLNWKIYIWSSFRKINSINIDDAFFINSFWFVMFWKFQSYLH